MTARSSLLSMSLVGALPGLALAIFGAMGGISGWGGTLMIMYWLAAVVGGFLALWPLLIVAGIFPKTAGAVKSKAAKAEKPAKGKEAKAAAAAEPASEELSVSDEPAMASDEFEAVDDDEFGSAEFEEFEEEEEK